MMYFSYGSNMSVRRLKDRVPSANVIGIATLTEHVLRFHKSSRDGSGKCDAYQTNDPADHVLGVVFEISASEKPSLDAKEGLGYGYDQKMVSLTTPSGDTIEAVTYYATNIDASLQPYEWYLHHVLAGAEENELPAEYVQMIRETNAIADPNRDRHDREMAIYD